MKVQESIRTRLVDKIPRVSDIVSFRFERPKGHEYRAGQWFVLVFPGPEGPLEHHFSYSSSPTEPYLELTTRLRGSEFKSALAALPTGSEVQIEGPYGAFTLQEDPGRVAFIAGGIGITCVRSILRWVTDTTGSSLVGPPGYPPAGRRSRRFVLLFANRSEAEIPFRDELEGMEDTLAGFRIVYVLSQAGDTWPGHRGHIGEAVLAEELPNVDDWTYYMSGPPTFVEEMHRLVTARGVGSESLRAERFDGYE